MARAQLGAILSDLRGKVGGGIFQRSAQGLTLRTATTPINAQSATQQSNRAQMFSLQQSWGALSEDTRTSWEAWASYQGITIGTYVTAATSGQLAYIQVNRYRLATGLAVLSSPVFTPYSQPSPTLSLRLVTAVFTLRLTGMQDEDLYRPILQLSNRLPPARNARPNNVALMVPFVSEGATDWTITAPFLAAYGAQAPVGARLWYSLMVQQVDNGALSIQTQGVTPIV
jgi:hypothetical protein